MSMPITSRPIDGAPSESDGAIRTLSPLTEFVSEFRHAWQTQSCGRIAHLLSSQVIWVNAYGELFNGAPEVLQHLKGTLCPAFDPDISREEAQQMFVSAMQHVGDDAVSIQLMTKGSGRGTAVCLVAAETANKWMIHHCVISRSL